MNVAKTSVPSSPAGWPTVPRDQPVTVVGPNPATDRLQMIRHLESGEVHRAIGVESRAGGKSFIVARSIRRRGVDVVMYGFIGGETRVLAEAEQAALGITNRHTLIGEPNRLTTVLVEQDSGRSTVINEPGPRISEEEQRQFRDHLIADMGPGDLVVCTGSLPLEVPRNLYAQVVALAEQKRAQVLVDASGEALAAVLAGAPWIVKCNVDEFSAATRLMDANDERALLAAMRAQCLRGTAAVIVTKGGRAFFVATADEFWRVTVPQVEVVNATGSGDTFLGCLVAAAARGATFADALRDAAAGGSVNASKFDPGLQEDSDLGPFRSTVEFVRI